MDQADVKSLAIFSVPNSQWPDRKLFPLFVPGSLFLIFFLLPHLLLLNIIHFTYNIFYPTLSPMTVDSKLAVLQGEINWAWDDADHVVPISTLSGQTCMSYSITSSNGWVLTG